MKDLAAFAGVLLLLPLLILSVRLAGQRFALSGEIKRKAIHVGMGLSCLSFPWLFSSWIWVAALCAASLALLSWVRQREMLAGSPSVLHDIDRRSLGESCFPVAVVAVFALAKGEAWRYVIPILVLTLADAAGALVGVRYGRQKFRVFSGLKTTEGSLLVFLVAFLSVHVPLLLLTETGRAETLLIALVLAILAMLVEAISVRGLDNLVLPVLVALLLPVYTAMDQAALVRGVAVALGLLVLVLSLRRDSSLEGGALLAAVLLGYATFYFGGLRFLILPLILFLEHLWVGHRLRRPESPLALESNDLWAIFGLALSFLPSLLLAASLPASQGLALRCLATAASVHLACVNHSTWLYVTRRPANEWRRQRSILKALLLVLLPGFALSGWDANLPAQAVAAVLLVETGMLVFRLASGNPASYPNNRQRWLLQGGVGAACSALLWGLSLLLQS